MNRSIIGAISVVLLTVSFGCEDSNNGGSKEALLELSLLQTATGYVQPGTEPATMPFPQDPGNVNYYSYMWKVIPGDSMINGYVGVSVSVSGDSVLIGASGANEGKGCAYVFARNGIRWERQVRMVDGNGALNDGFGYSVAMSGDLAVVGAPAKNGWKGAAFVFKRVNGSWSYDLTLTASDGAANNNYGESVAVYGDTVVIGAKNKNQVYVYRKSAAWAEKKLVVSNSVAGDFFGKSVAIDENTIVVGAFGDDNMGSAYVFKLNGTNWTQEQRLVADNRVVGDNFGTSVSISGNTAVVGAYFKDAYKGAAYVFQRSGSSWTLEKKLTASDIEVYDCFGESVSISDTMIVAGSPFENEMAHGAGAAYWFEQKDGSWNEKSKLKAPSGKAGVDDNFGWSVSIDGNTIAIGVPYDNERGSNWGAIYIFSRSTTPLSAFISSVKARPAMLGIAVGGAILAIGALAAISIYRRRKSST